MRPIETTAEEALSAAIDAIDFELSCVNPAIEVMELCDRPPYMNGANAYLRGLRNWLVWRRRLLLQEACL